MRMLLVLLLATTLFAADRKVIHPKEFPAGRPYSPGILVDGTLYVSGQTGQNPKSGQIPADFDAEVRQCLDNAGLVLKAAGMGFSDAVAVQVYMTDMNLFQQMNGIYTTYFKEPRPARTTVGVARLVGTARIEITVTAKR